MAAQARRACERLEAILSHAEATFEQTVSLRAFTTDPDAYARNGLPVLAEELGGHRPPSAELVIPCLFDPAMCIEVELIVDLGETDPDRPLLERIDVEDHGIDYAQGVIVNGGRLVYAAGQVANDPDGSTVGIGDMACQAQKAYENVGHVLDAAGACPSDVVREAMWVRDMEAWNEIGAPVRAAFYEGLFPAATLLGIQQLSDADKLVEIEIIAAVE
jgi:enamine deaminase RidA (YjgF/YER057c/UK114 family)